jgi:hypothetical protein
MEEILFTIVVEERCSSQIDEVFAGKYDHPKPTNIKTLVAMFFPGG